MSPDPELRSQNVWDLSWVSLRTHSIQRHSKTSLQASFFIWPCWILARGLAVIGTFQNHGPLRWASWGGSGKVPQLDGLEWQKDITPWFWSWKSKFKVLAGPLACCKPQRKCASACPLFLSLWSLCLPSVKCLSQVQINLVLTRTPVLLN